MVAAPGSVIVRRALPSDAVAVARLSDALGYPVEVDQVTTRLAELLDSSDDAVFVAEDAAGRVVGWRHVFVARRVETDAFAEIGGLVVAADWRRRGIGRRLMESADRWAEANSLSSLRVRSNKVREAAHAFYLGLGFERIKDQAVYSRRSPSPTDRERPEPRRLPPSRVDRDEPRRR